MCYKSTDQFQLEMRGWHPSEQRHYYRFETIHRLAFIGMLIVAKLMG
jgi:hypothetical protein